MLTLLITTTKGSACLNYYFYYYYYLPCYLLLRARDRVLWAELAHFRRLGRELACSRTEQSRVRM